MKADSTAVARMVCSSANLEGTRWAAYQNQALDSASAGHLQFLAIGPENTYQEAPEQMPDTQHGMGWKYRFVGWVDLETGEVSEAR